MEVRIDDDVDASVRWVVKTSSSAMEAARLEKEAAQLSRAAHPGVVELGPSNGAELRTRYAGRSLRVTGPLSAAELCGLGAAVATILADLHDLGIVHGAVDADHILIGPDGRPVLCGLASSVSTDDGDPADDVGDLITTLSEGLGPDAPGRLVKVLGPTGSRGARPPGTVRRGHRHRRSTPSARALAATLGAAMADCRLPRPTASGPAGRAEAGIGEPAEIGAGERVEAGGARPAKDPVGVEASTTLDGAGDGHRTRRRTVASGEAQPRGRSQRSDPEIQPCIRHRRRPRRVRAVAVAAVVVAAIVVGAVAAAGLYRQGPSGRTASRLAVCPSADLGCTPIPVHDGAFITAAGRFTVAISDPVVVVGRWGCGPTSLPAALDPRTGQVWAWLTWAGPTRPVTATAIRSAPGATTLRVVPGASGCDLLRVVDRTGRSTVLRPGAGRGA